MFKPSFRRYVFGDTVFKEEKYAYWRPSGTFLKKHHLERFRLTKIYDTCNIDILVVCKDDRGQGHGTRILKMVCRWADTEGVTLTLQPSLRYGATSLARLKRLYGRFGFRTVRSRHDKDSLGDRTMKREPDASRQRPAE